MADDDGTGDDTGDVTSKEENADSSNSSVGLRKGESYMFKNLAVFYLIKIRV